MKKSLLLLALVMAGAQTLRAQGSETFDYNRDDPYREMRRMANKGYTNIALSMQTMTTAESLLGLEFEYDSVADWGASISRSRTFVLHRNPLARMIYLGIDATWVDINYAQHGNDVMGIDLSDLTNGFKMHQADISLLGFGPSVHVFPVGKLGLHAYAKYLPTFATIFSTEDEFRMSAGYASVFTVGTAASWGVISAGVETRFGGGDYKKLFGDSADIGRYHTAGMRLYLSLRY